MPGQISTQIDQHLSQWIYTQFNQLNSTGQIGCKSIEIMTTKFDQAYNVISMNFYPNRPACISMNGFTPNSTGRIGCKSIEITLPVKGIRPVKFDQSNWV